MKKQPDKGKITALYERLSHDDERAGESVSIENQKRILEDYAQKNGFTNIRHFTDDGVRGTTFKRPGLDAMLEEIRAGNVATVIIKDQSRIGRDVVEVGLLKRTFDEYHVRFIAANDNLDTANGFDIMSIFRDVINEWYVADTSRKIKTVFKSRMEKGLRCSGSVSYGYLASKENKGEWVIDEEAAAVVRRIFQSVVAGESIASIGHYGRLRKVYLEQYRHRLYTALVASEKLYPHLEETDRAARDMLDYLMPRLAREAGATEALKAADPMKWVGLMNNCKARAEEIVMHELIYV